MGNAWEKEWFTIRENMGYSDMVTMRYQDVGQSLVIEDFAHRNGDGLGKMRSILAKAKIFPTVESKKIKSPPNWMSLPLLLKGLKVHPRLKANPWRQWTFIKCSSSVDSVASIVWDEAKSKAFNEKARKLGVSSGFLLLSEITAWVEKNLFAVDSKKATWMCPVDMRGAFPDATADDMCVSFVPAVFALPITKESCQQSFANYKAALKRGDYWGIWELAKVGKWIGLNGMKFLAQANEQKCHWTGTFSDLGKWDQPELRVANIQSREWTIAPPGSPTHPIGIISIEWCGRRNISVKIHPSITTEDPVLVAQRLLDQSFS
jgi:hypothetical protein